MADRVRKTSVILLSGGLDSAAGLAFCVTQDLAVLAITCDYGQRAARSEIAAAQKLCAHYGVTHQIVDVPWLERLGGSSLTEDSRDVPKLRTDQLDDLTVTRESALSVWVPNRNGVFINIAAAFAESMRAERVIVGFNREEAVTFPDNSTAYLRSASDALTFSTANGVQVFSYTSELDKREIVRELRRLPSPFPFKLVWSCYHSGNEPCGSCESCRRFNRAIEAS